MVQLLQKPMRPTSTMKKKKGANSTAPKKDFLITLPIMSFEEELGEALLDNKMTILTAETGAGKSTGAVKIARDLGFKVLVLEPRVVSAKELSTAMNSCGVKAGYKTGQGSQNTKAPVIYATYGVGINLIPELDEEWLVVFDEVHEWSSEMEIAPAIHQVSQTGARALIMSATIDLTKVSKVYPQAPIIKVPGRTYEIEDLEVKETPLDTIMHCLEQGWHTMLFLPGQFEIDQWTSKVQNALLSLSSISPDQVEIVPFIGTLNEEGLKKPFNEPEEGMTRLILATDIGQTGLTIPYLDVVGNLGLDRQIQVRNGVEGLYTVPSSAATNEQRRGRVGRVKPGKYFFQPLHSEEVPPYDTPEILRCQLSSLILRVASLGYNLRELETFHKPEETAFNIGVKELQMLGCLNEEEKITQLGKEVSRLPLSPKAGVFFIKALDKGLPEGFSAILASILSEGEVTHSKNKGWKDQATICYKSDPVTQANLCLDVMQRRFLKGEIQEKGLMWKHFVRVRGNALKLSSDIELEFTEKPTEEEETAYISLLQEVNRDKVYRCIGRGLVVPVESVENPTRKEAEMSRKVSFSTITSVYSGDIVVGKEFDISGRRLLTEVTVLKRAE